MLLNNAGILLYEPFLDLKWPDLRRVVDVDLVGPIALTRLVGERMVKRGRGVIIHTSSQLVYNGAEFRAVYAAAKAAISQLVKTAALEWGRAGVRVNAIAPGRTLTKSNRHLLSDPAEYAKHLERIPLGRYGQPEDIANVAVFLASERRQLHHRPDDRGGRRLGAALDRGEPRRPWLLEELCVGRDTGGQVDLRAPAQLAASRGDLQRAALVFGGSMASSNAMSSGPSTLRTASATSPRLLLTAGADVVGAARQGCGIEGQDDSVHHVGDVHVLAAGAPGVG